MSYLSGTNIYLRAIEPEDLDILYQWENDSSLWVHGCTLAPFSKFTLRGIHSKQLLRYLSDPTTTNDDYFKKNERNNRNGRFVRDRPTSRKRSGRYSYSAGSSKERFRQ